MVWAVKSVWRGKLPFNASQPMYVVNLLRDHPEWVKSSLCGQRCQLQQELGWDAVSHEQLGTPSIVRDSRHEG